MKAQKTGAINIADLIVQTLVAHGVSDVFGYQGGMVTHLANALDAHKSAIRTHFCYHEQGAAFAACGFALETQNLGVAFATSGPGATNLLTGLANAYFDSIPCLFITGNVRESRGALNVRQFGFQEMDIVSVAAPITKFAVQIRDKNEVLFALEKAIFAAKNPRRGAVLLDIAMHIFNESVNLAEIPRFSPPPPRLNNFTANLSLLFNALQSAQKPVFIVGLGAKNAQKNFQKILETLKIPTLLSMPNIDFLPRANPLNFGFLGAYGSRTANIICHKADLVIALGARLDLRQIGSAKENFAPNAQLFRIDIDENELENKIKPSEVAFCCDCGAFLEALELDLAGAKTPDFSPWIRTCQRIRAALKNHDKTTPNRLIAAISRRIPKDSTITTDVGQNQVWVAQSFRVKRHKIHFSASFGAMGCALPMAIGAFFGRISRQKIYRDFSAAPRFAAQNPKRFTPKPTPIYAFCGDGGFMMNVQELEFVRRFGLPVKIILLNNKSLGMIRHFQESYFAGRYVGTTADSGYFASDFRRLARAYHLDYFRIRRKKDIKRCDFTSPKPAIIEVLLDFETYIFPKLDYGSPNYAQSPALEPALLAWLLSL